MDNCIVNSSVWIDFFNKKFSIHVEKLMKIFPTSISEGIIIILPIMLQEVLLGIKDYKFYSLGKKNLFGIKQF